jgi:hypothetical protein
VYEACVRLQQLTCRSVSLSFARADAQMRCIPIFSNAPGGRARVRHVTTRRDVVRAALFDISPPDTDGLGKVFHRKINRHFDLRGARVMIW